MHNSIDEQRPWFERSVAVIDRWLTVVLLALVVLMVFSITAEIVLNAALQPVVAASIEHLQSGREGSASSQPSAALRFLESVRIFISNASAPVNTTSQTLLVWIGILGSALAFRLRSHLGVDALVRLYPPRVRLILDYSSTVFVGLFSLAVLVAGGWVVASRAFSTGSKMPGIEQLNRGWFYLVLILAGALNLLYCAYHLRNPAPVETTQPCDEERVDE